MSSKRSFIDLEDDDEDEQRAVAFAYFGMRLITGSLPASLLMPFLRPLLPKPPQRRRIHKVPRPDGGVWAQMEDVWPTLPGTMCDEKYYQYFRLNKAGFDHVFSLVEDDIEQVNDNERANPGARANQGQAAIPPRQVFACVLRWFAVGGSYNSVCDDFKMARSTMQKYARPVAIAINERFACDQIKWPTGEELVAVMDDFRQLCGLPKVAGAIDGTFLEMKSPGNEFKDRYWCYKNKIAILMLAVVDCSGKFIWVDIGRPSSVGDAGAFRSSDLSDLLASRIALPLEHDEVLPCGTILQPYLLGDEAFPLLPYLQRCYEGNINERSVQGMFNRAVINGRRVVEQAFGRLKGRWRILLHKVELRNPSFYADVAQACCALHNYCEEIRLETVYPYIPNASIADDPLLGSIPPQSGTQPPALGRTIRVALTNYLATARGVTNFNPIT